MVETARIEYGRLPIESACDYLGQSPPARGSYRYNSLTYCLAAGFNHVRQNRDPAKLTRAIHAAWKISRSWRRGRNLDGELRTILPYSLLPRRVCQEYESLAEFVKDAVAAARCVNIMSKLLSCTASELTRPPPAADD